MTTTTTDHGITITEVEAATGGPLQASCLCGWLSPIVRSRAQAGRVGQDHVEQAHLAELAPPPQWRDAVRRGEADTMEDLGIVWTDKGMTLHRPVWCRTDAEWLDYQQRMTDWWTAYLDGFLAAKRICERAAAR